MRKGQQVLCTTEGPLVSSTSGGTEGKGFISALPFHSMDPGVRIRTPNPPERNLLRLTEVLVQEKQPRKPFCRSFCQL